MRMSRIGLPFKWKIVASLLLYVFYFACAMLCLLLLKLFLGGFDPHLIYFFLLFGMMVLISGFFFKKIKEKNKDPFKSQKENP